MQKAIKRLLLCFSWIWVCVFVCLCVCLCVFVCFTWETSPRRPHLSWSHPLAVVHKSSLLANTQSWHCVLAQIWSNLFERTFLKRLLLKNTFLKRFSTKSLYRQTRRVDTMSWLTFLKIFCTDISCVTFYRLPNKDQQEPTCRLWSWYVFSSPDESLWTAQ